MENTQTKKQIPLWGWVLIGLLALGGISSLGTSRKGAEDKPTPTPTKVENKQTQAKINFTGTKFVITNANNFDWVESEIIINEKYRYKAGLIESGSTYEIGAGQFTDSKNNRFNPFEIKPAEIRIYVKEPMSDDWYGELK